MIGALIAVISLNVTNTLVTTYDVIAGTLTITNATVTTPIQVTSPKHGVPPGRVLHGVITGVIGTTEANGTWELSYVDPNTLSLANYTAQGISTPSVGVHTYLGGGQIQYAFPDRQILLGRRNVALSSAVASPRIVFVPTDGRAWGFEPYGGLGPAPPQQRGSLEQQSQRLQPALATEFTTFEVYVTGSAPDYGASAPSPDFADFDATQAIVWALYAAFFDAVGGPPRAKILHESWPSQKEDAASMLQRGQQWMGILELQQNVSKAPRQYVNIGTYVEMTVEPINAGSTDPELITILPP